MKDTGFWGSRRFKSQVKRVTEARPCVAREGFLSESPERALGDAVKVKPDLQWRDTRLLGRPGPHDSH